MHRIRLAVTNIFRRSTSAKVNKAKLVALSGIAVILPFLCLLSPRMGTTYAQQTRNMESLGNFYSLSAKDIDGKNIDFKDYAGSVCYIINVASE